MTSPTMCWALVISYRDWVVAQQRREGMLLMAALPLKAGKPRDFWGSRRPLLTVLGLAVLLCNAVPLRGDSYSPFGSRRIDVEKKTESSDPLVAERIGVTNSPV